MTERRLPKTAVENLVEELASKANADLSNLDATGQAKFDAKANIALTNSPYTTNRILEIPQDIKLELNNGTLTLKAGSKLYYPNGFEADGNTPKFDVITIESDVTYSAVYTSAVKCYAMYDYSAKKLQMIGLHDGRLSYDSTTNKVIHTALSDSVFSFPFALVVRDTTGIGSIESVFNGFGYIGSTLFLLPGVKTVVPDGRNENGTCKNKAPSTVASVKTETISAADTAYMFTNQVSSVIATHHYVCSKTKPTVTATTLWYNPETNLPSQVLSDGTVMTPYSEIPLAKFTSDSTGKITSFTPFTVDSVLNSSLSNLSPVGQAKFDAKANVSNTVTTDTAQTISGVKTFTTNTIVNGGAGRGTFTIKNDVTDYGTSAVDLVVATENGKNQFLVHFQEGNKWCAYFEQNPSTKDVAFTMGGCVAVYVPTPAGNANDTQVATTAWVNSKMQVVSALPANPDPNVFYFIPG